jgi:predicted Ser/Thr protein kinase
LARGDPGAPKEQVDCQLEWFPSRASGVVEVAYVLPVVDHEDGVGRFIGQRDRAADLVLADHCGRDQQSGNAGIGEHFGLAETRRATSNGAGLEQRPGDFGTLVGLAVRTKGLLPRLEMRGHLRDVVFEGVEIEEQGRGRNVTAQLHRSRMLTETERGKMPVKVSLARGTRLGSYVIEDSIGAGGMGEVYRAVDTTLQRVVALKVLPDHLVADPEQVARFEREATTLALINHPNVAQIYGLAHDDTGRGALVMEFVDGEDLGHLIRRAPGVDRVLEVARQVAAGLEAAHDLGVIHRDLKPANIKVRVDGTVKVLDFGIARVAQPPGPSLDAASTVLPPTAAGTIVGTPAYMSPEQATGRRVDRRSDLWSFGCVLFEMLSGDRLFKRRHHCRDHVLGLAGSS